MEAGRYKHVSAAFYAPDSPRNPKPGVYYLRHVGALGAVPPSIKGLGPLTFAEDDTVFIAFGEDNPADNPNEAPMDKKTDAASAKEAENAQLRRQLDEMRARMEKQEADRRHADNVAFAEELVTSGRLAAAHRDIVAAALDALGTPQEDGTLIAFGEGDEAGPLAERFRAFLASAEPQVMFSEFAVNGTSSPRNRPSSPTPNAGPNGRKGDSPCRSNTRFTTLRSCSGNCCCLKSTRHTAVNPSP